MKNLSLNWRELVVENPMTIEITRFRRRNLSMRSANAAVVLLIGIAWFSAMYFVIAAKGDIPPTAIIEVQAGLYALLGPAWMYGTIAGEREKRTWDVLLAAPVTHAQIVVGKFLAGAAAVLLIAVATVVPLLTSAIMYRQFGIYRMGTVTDGSGVNWYDMALAEIVTITFGFGVCALTLFFSARVRRPLAALGTSIGILAIYLLGLPALFTGAVGFGGTSSELMLWGNPFAVVYQIHIEGGTVERSYLAGSLWGWPQIALQLAFVVVALSWATKTLVFAENDVKFIPRPNDA